MVEKNPHLAICVLLVAEGVLHFGLASIRSAGEAVVSQCNGHVAAHIDLVVLKDDV